MSLSFDSVDSDQSINFFLGEDDTINGTLLEGSVSGNERIDPFAANGDYVLSGISIEDNAGNDLDFDKGDSGWEQFLTSANIQQTSFSIQRKAEDDDKPAAVDANGNGLVDNRSVYTLFNGGDPITLIKERSDGSTRTFSTTRIPKWDATQAITSSDGSGFNVLLEGAEGTTRADQFKVWCIDSTGKLSSATRWTSAEQLAQDGWEERFGTLNMSENTSVPLV